MKMLAIFLMLFVPVSPSFGQLDLEQEVLIIPDTHDAKPYIWDVMRNPRGFHLVMDKSTNEEHHAFQEQKEVSL